MTDLAADFSPTMASITRIEASRSSALRIGQTKFAVALSISLALGLTIPSSEVRAKTFRLALVAKMLRSHCRI